MNEINQNKFYTSIAKYYSEIFPYNPVQLNFVKSRAGELTGKQILDIGCATGELSYELARTGGNVFGIDLNDDLLNQAKSNKIHPNLHFQKGNMLELKKDFHEKTFDVVLCFGNTLVHLNNLDEIRQILQGVYWVLKPHGLFLIQILNYDYILDEPVSQLPMIDTENIKFIRKYEFNNESIHVNFKTELILKKENEMISNATMLLPLKSNYLKKSLVQVGFKEIEFFSSFKLEPFGGKHLPSVVSCKK